MNVIVPAGCRSPEQLEQQIYDHLLHCVRSEFPDQVLQRFQLLFLQGGAYPDPAIRMTLNEIISGRSAKKDFLPFFNRCCFILINRWQINALHRDAVVRLVELLMQCRGPSALVGNPSPSGRLRYAVQEYVRSSYFTQIQQLSAFLNPKNDQDTQKPLATILHRYPYLYPHCLNNQDNGEEYQKIITVTQRTAQKKFEGELSSYLTHSLLKSNRASRDIDQALKNPTLLSHQDLCATLKHYVTKVDDQGTYQDMAQQFWSPVHRPQSYAAFKGTLHNYILRSMPDKFGKCRFHDQLHHYLKNLNPESNGAAVNDFLVVRTCNQLINFMVVESRQRPNHAVFMDLLNNMGSTQTVGLLLKIVLLCNKAKPYLERRVSILFQHYQGQTQNSVIWLVRCLEKLNLAWTAHFSNQNLSYVHLL